MMKSAFRRAALGALAMSLLSGAAFAQELSDADKAISNTVAIGDAAGTAPTAWLGETPHFVLVGALKDVTFNIQATDLAATPDFEVSAKREYRAAASGTGLDYIDFEIGVKLVTNGIERGIELEFENADYADHPLPASFALTDANFPEGPLSNMELEIEWEWVEKSVIVNEEVLYTEGTLDIARDQGTPDADGTSPNGLIGGFVTGTYEGKPIAISFTVPVSETEIDD